MRPHGFTEVLYAYTSSTGKTARPSQAHRHTFFTTYACQRDVRRPLLHDHSGMAIAGSHWRKKSVPASAGTFPTTVAVHRPWSSA